jgi:hypothetical protein
MNAKRLTPITQEVERPTNPKEDFPVVETSVPMLIDKDTYSRLIDRLEAPIFTVKDSGQRQEFESGMVRDTTTGKVDYSLCFDGPMFERLAEHLTKGAEKYEARNWMKASGEEELTRFKTSAIRHFMQWMRGERDEDHAAAVFFNINGYEYVKEKL